MSDEEIDKKIDKMFEILSKPINKHILAILTGINPGKYEGATNSQKGEPQNRKKQ